MSSMYQPFSGGRDILRVKSKAFFSFIIKVETLFYEYIYFKACYGGFCKATAVESTPEIMQTARLELLLSFG